ncbi:isoleucine--tRNA ligase [Spirochaetota bacterium]
MFETVSNKVRFPGIEKEILDIWNKKNIFRKSLESRKNSEKYIFYDGPPFATGLPHYGNLLPGTIKDIIPRYYTMRGKYVPRRFGWDCHGLPVEYEMEKELGLNGKQEIEDFGIDKFNESCRSIVLRHVKEWRSTVERMGRWVDFDNDYKTMDPSYMESIFWVFKSLWDKKLVYEGAKIVPYCPRCATPLSNFETNQGYREVTDPAITIKFKSLDEENTYFLAWTTTPWTLPSNLALAVGPDVPYIKVKDKDENYILAEERLGVYYKDESEYAVIERYKAKDLYNKRYEPLLPYFSSLTEKGAFRVLPADFVTTEDGTGIVHIAPGFGEDDYEIGKKQGLPPVVPLDDEGKFTDEVSDYKGIFVKDADKQIIQRLKKERKLVYRSTVTHSYPFCWRCDTPLIYRTISTWFIDIEKIKAKMIKVNKKINWVPAHLKDGRFGKWLEGARDWAISRNRYWGAPIPVWKSEDGKETICIGSIAELEKLSGEKVSDLHKHFLDKIEITSPSTGNKLRRIREVLDCWFESGSMPYAQSHYPFENKEEFEKNFPADFIAEGLDQTRGWFYTLVVISAALFDDPPFKNVVVNGLVLAEDGKKMSKRLKNYPAPEYIIDEYGADALRMYLMDSPVVKAEDLKFSEAGVKEVLKSTLIPLWNAFSFFISYANIDSWEYKNLSVSELGNPLDRWIISAMEGLKADIVGAMDQYDLQKAIAPFLNYIDQLTNWYIRRSRRRFWKSENDEDKAQAYFTLYTVLLDLAKILAPFIPFMAEKMYLVLTLGNEKESVHLEDYPVTDNKWRDLRLEKEMALIRTAVAMGRHLRLEHKVKVRQPLKSIHYITKDDDEIAILQANSDIIKDELNIKDVLFDKEEEELLELTAKANFKVLGPKLGSKVKEAAKEIEKLTYRDLQSLGNGGKVKVSLGSEEITITGEDIEIRRKEKEGLKVINEDTLTAVLDIQLTDELIDEGFARDFINKVQKMRKEKDLDYIDRIKIYFNSSSPVKKGIQNNLDYVKNETLAIDVLEAEKEKNFSECDVNGEACFFSIEKIS